MTTVQEEVPSSPEQLHDWIRLRLGAAIPREPIQPGHTAPFDYIAWSFFGDPEGVTDAVVWANRGGGKTFLGAVATALDLVFRDGIEVRILAGSLEQAARMHRHLRRFFAEGPLAELVAGRITDRRIALLNGSSVELLAQSQTAVRGTRVQKLRCDEVELFDPAVWEAAQLTTRSKVCRGALIQGGIECLSTMHVPHGIMHDLIADAADGARRLFRWGVVDVLASCGADRTCGADREETRCPLWSDCAGRAKLRPGNASGVGVGHMEVRDVVRMKSRVSLPMWESEMLCLRPRRTDAVIPEFDPAVHLVDQLPPESPRARWIGGMDFGFRAPTVVLWARVDPDGRVFVFQELSRSGFTLGQNIEAVLDPANPTLQWIGVDPAGWARNDQTGRSPVEVLRGAGLNVRACRAAIGAGVELLRARLLPAEGGPRLFIHRRCGVLTESLQRYHYPADPLRDEPVKDGFDHAVDALRYMIQNLDRVHRAGMSNYLGTGG